MELRNIMQKRKILFLCNSMEVGGIENKIVKLIKYMGKNHFKYFLVLLKKRGKLLEKVPSNTPIYDLNFKRVWDIPISIIKYINFIKIILPDIVVCYGDKCLSICLLSKLFLNKKYQLVYGVENIMSVWIDYQKFKNIRKYFIKYFYPKASVILVVSKEIKKDLINNFGINPNKIKIIYNFCDLNYSLKSKKRFKKKDFERPLILYAGRLVKQKNINILVEAMYYLKKYIKARLLIVGNGPEIGNILSTIKKFNLNRFIEIKNFVIDVKREMLKATIFVLPSSSEGFPNSVIESMFLGVPVLLGKYPGYKEIINENITGFAITPEVDPKDLCNYLLKIFKNRKKFLTIANNAYRFSKKFSKYKVIPSYEKFFLSL